jgi:hypothetical protein
VGIGLPLLPTLLAPNGGGGGELGADIKPGCDCGATAERCGLSSEVNEHLLGDVLREVGVTTDAPKRCRIDETEPTIYELRESEFIMVVHIAAEKF